MKHASAQKPTLSDMRLSRRQAGILALGGLGVVAGVGASQAAPSNMREVSSAQRASDTEALLKLMNAFRAENGVGPLNHSATLAGVMEPEARRQVNAGAVSHGTAFMNDPKVQGNTFSREIIALSYNDDLNELL